MSQTGLESSAFYKGHEDNTGIHVDYISNKVLEMKKWMRKKKMKFSRKDSILHSFWSCKIIKVMELCIYGNISICLFKKFSRLCKNEYLSTPENSKDEMSVGFVAFNQYIYYEVFSHQ